MCKPIHAVSLLLALVASSGAAVAQQDAVLSRSVGTRVLRSQPAMHHVGARFTYKVVVSGSPLEASMRRELHTRIAKLPVVHFRH